ncbi:MAG TPA: hypothetical protein VLC74_02360 [Rhizomicrobium sp.]|nr:hypothetical protein [Rhizomicrobium sp.]
MVGMPDEDEIAILREKAREARLVAAMISDKEAAQGLVRFAEEYEARAAALEAEVTLPPPAAIPSGEPPVAQAGVALKPDLPPKPEGEGSDG